MIYKFRDVQTQQAVPLPPGEYIVGREDDCHFVIDNTSVSRHHATIVNTERGVFIEDAGSSNGTLIGGQRITAPTPLKVGEVVYFGNACFRLDPEVTGDADKPLVQSGLKPLGRNSVGFHKATDRVPLRTIHFDDQASASSTTATATLEAPPTTLASSGMTPVAAPKIPKRATVTLPTRDENTESATLSTARAARSTVNAPSNSPAVAKPVVATLAATPIVSAQPAAVSVPMAKPATISSEEFEIEPHVPWKLTLTLAFGAGIAVGIFLGLAIAYYWPSLVHLAK